MLLDFRDPRKPASALEHPPALSVYPNPMHSAVKLTAAVCSVILPYCSLAQDPAVPAAVAAPPKKTVLKPIEFIQYTLPNGLHVILHENHAAPVISTYVLYHVGSKNERPDRTGFAHFFEHLMFEGSENIPRGQIDKFISGAGGNLNASTSFDQTDYYFNLPANQLRLALWIESERMLQAKVDETGVETQRKVVKEERRRGVDNQPYGTLFEELAAFLFRGTPYSWTPIGSFQYIDQATIDEFRQFYKTYYLPNNATLAVAGDINIEETKKLIEEYFGGIPKGEAIQRPKIEWDIAAAGSKKEVVKDNTPLPATLHAWRAPAETHPDAYPLELLTNILATGRSSRLYKRLVEKEQAALDVEAFPYLLEKAGMLGVFATGQAGIALDQLDELITQEVEETKKNGVTEEEFQKARNTKEAEFANAFGTMNSRAKNLARYHVFYGDANLINTELERYLAVKREDLQKVANKYFTREGAHILRYPVPDAKTPSNAAAAKQEKPLQIPATPATATETPATKQAPIEVPAGTVK
jgi:zinc protease